MSEPIRCRARHPAAVRGAPAFARSHDAPLPVTFADDVEVVFVEMYKGGPILHDQFVVACKDKDCGALHLFEIRRKAA